MEFWRTRSQESLEPGTFSARGATCQLDLCYAKKPTLSGPRLLHGLGRNEDEENENKALALLANMMTTTPSEPISSRSAIRYPSARVLQVLPFFRACPNPGNGDCFWYSIQALTHQTLEDMKSLVHAWVFQHPAHPAFPFPRDPACTSEWEVDAAVQCLHLPAGLLVLHVPSDSFVFYAAGRRPQLLSWSTRLFSIFQHSPCLLYTESQRSEIGHFELLVSESPSRASLPLPVGIARPWLSRVFLSSSLPPISAGMEASQTPQPTLSSMAFRKPSRAQRLLATLQTWMRLWTQ